MNKSYFTMYPEYNFAKVRFGPGDLSVDELLQINTEYKMHPDYSKIHYAVLIFSDCTPNFSKDDLVLISEKFSQNFQDNNHKKRVFIVDKPLLTAFAKIFIDSIFDTTDYCSTIEKSYQLLNVSLTFEEYCAIVQENE